MNEEYLYEFSMVPFVFLHSSNREFDNFFICGNTWWSSTMATYRK